MLFATRARRSRVVCPSWSSHFFMRANHTKLEPAIRLVYPYFFGQLSSASNPTDKNLTQLRHEIQAVLSRQLFIIRHIFKETFFPHNVRQYHLPKYWPFLLNQSVYLICTVSIVAWLSTQCVSITPPLKNESTSILNRSDLNNWIRFLGSRRAAAQLRPANDFWIPLFLSVFYQKCKEWMRSYEVASVCLPTCVCHPEIIKRVSINHLNQADNDRATCLNIK
jgi:hypothetical protein